MRDIRDPQNPYRDEYGPWDLWAYVNETSVLAGEGNVNIWVDKPGWETLRMGIDADGWPMPQLESYRRNLEWEIAGPVVDAGKAPCTHSITARGKPDRKMMLELEYRKRILDAAYYPQIPQWLSRSMPAWAMLLPGGEVVAHGMASGKDMLFYPAEDELRCYRYSADGELLGQTGPGQEWPWLYHDFDAELAACNDPDAYACTSGGKVLILKRDEDAGGRVQILQRFTYDGTRVISGQADKGAGRTSFTKIPGSRLRELYDLQQGHQGSGT